MGSPWGSQPKGQPSQGAALGEGCTALKAALAPADQVCSSTRPDSQPTGQQKRNKTVGQQHQHIRSAFKRIKRSYWENIQVRPAANIGRPAAADLLGVVGGVVAVAGASSSDSEIRITGGVGTWEVDTSLDACKRRCGRRRRLRSTRVRFLLGGWGATSSSSSSSSSLAGWGSAAAGRVGNEGEATSGNSSCRS